MSFNNIDSTADRWIDLGVDKIEYLQQLHHEVVLLASPYHKRLLQRLTDIYKELSADKRKQVKKYGVSGVLKLYDPHMTLFYQYPPDAKLQKAVEVIKNSIKSNVLYVQTQKQL